MSQTMRDLKEAGLLSLFGPMLRQHTEGLPLGTGDDVAITHDRLVWTIDTMVEGTHFLWYDDPLCTPEAIATKLVASNVSDLCSKGATPLHALLSLGVPATAPVEKISRFYTGLDAALTRYGLRLIGGDTVGAPVWTLTLTVVGHLPVGSPIAARSAAVPGMSVYTTGWPGESGAGLVLLQQPAVAFDTEARAHLVRRHLAPEVHPELATQLVARAEQIAMIDLSDGVAKDAGEIARASGVALVIDKLPVSPFLALGAKALGKAPEEFILHGGEDYELLFCTSLPEEALRSVFTGHPIHQIGFVEEGEGVHLLRDGVRMPIGSAAFDHFR